MAVIEANFEDKYLARLSYERFILRQPNVIVEGLWKKDDKFYVVCPRLDSQMTKDGEPLIEWFDYNCRNIGSSIDLVLTAPPDAIQIPARTMLEIAEMNGSFMNSRSMHVQLAIMLPADFPDFNFTTKFPDAFIYFADALSDNQESILRDIYNRLTCYLGMTLKIIIDPDKANILKPFRYPKVQGDIDIMPGKMAPKAWGAALRARMEEDDSFWAKNRVSILSTDINETRKFLPSEFVNDKSKCFINTLAPSGNLRSLIPLYKRILVTMPLDIQYERALDHWNVGESELIELANRGRLQFILPQSIDRYPIRLVNSLAELDCNSMMLSRQLAAANIVDTRRRFPLLYPPLDVEQRKWILKMLCSLKGPVSKFGEIIASILGECWASFDVLQDRGAMATSILGIGRILAAIYKAVSGTDFLIEFTHAGSSIEWGSLLGADIFPYESKEYSEYNNVSLCASIYSGIENSAKPKQLGKIETVVQGLRMVKNDASILELEEAFPDSDTDNLRKIIEKITSGSSPEEMNADIEKFNWQIDQFQYRKEALAELEVSTMAGALKACQLMTSHKPEYIHLGMWVVSLLFEHFDPSLYVSQQVLDYMNAAVTWTPKDVVLIARSRM